MAKSKLKKSQSNRFIFSLASFVYVLFLVGIAGVLVYAEKQKSFCANSESCISDLSGTMESQDMGVYMGKVVYAPKAETIADSRMVKGEAVLGVNSYEHKRIYIDLTNQRLYAFEGNDMVMDVPVSTGLWYPTPTGEFRIWTWLRYTRMSGGSGSGYYNLPNVPYTMYFFNSYIAKSNGYGIHGTYWHSNFGHPMSHGCVNMKTEDAEKLFYWSNPGAGSVSYPSANNPGTLITIYGKTPSG